MADRTRIATQATVAGVCMLLLTSCFGGAGGGGGASGGKAAGYTQMSKNPGEPVKGGTYVASSPSDATTLDPHKSSSFNTHITVGSVYSKLMDYKTGPNLKYGSTEIEGDLAESVKKNADATEWTVKLKKGVKFQNVAPVNGREFTSADVVCTLDRIKKVGFQKNLISMVASYETPDPYTVIFKLNQEFATFDYNLANHYMEMLPCEATAGQVDLNNTAVGTGPFILQSWTRNQERVYVANPDYYEKGKPYLDGIRVVIMPDQQSQIAALRSGKIDSMSSLSTDKRQVENLAKEQKGLQVMETQGATETRLFMNQTAAPFDKLGVRQAVAMAVDRQNMMETLRVVPTISGPVSPLLDGALPKDTLTDLQPFDIKKAKKLLADAGYPDGFDVKMVVTNGYGETVVQEAQWLQEDLSKIGIKVTLDVQDYTTYFTETWPKKNYQMGYGLQTPMLSADEYLTSEWLSNGARNWYGIADPKLDDMINASRGITSDKERNAKVQDIQKYIIQNVSNPIPLYTYGQQTLYASKVKNLWEHPEYSRRYLANMWLDK